MRTCKTSKWTVPAFSLTMDGRSETIRGLRGDGRDERLQAMDMRATLVSGSALLIAVPVA